MEKVYVGVGHGGDDPGACANGFQEKDLNLDVALACHEHLVASGVNSIISRTNDTFDSINDKYNEANSLDVDLVLDIHHNAGGGDGAEAIHTHKGGTGKTMAQNILNEVVAIGQNSRGCKTRLNEDGDDYYGMIRETNAPAVIVECAFVDNSKDIQEVDTVAERKEMGIAIAKGVLKTLGISSSEPSTPPSESKEIAPKPTLKKGSKGEEVKKLQKHIYVKTDGDFGSNTDTALRNWQKIYGLTIDGIYGSKSQAMMQDVIDGEAKRVYVPTVPTPTLEVGSSGQEVKELQVIINAKVDGDFGPKTEQTLMNWQKVYDLESDGVYGPLTEAKMKEVY